MGLARLRREEGPSLVTGACKPSSRRCGWAAPLPAEKTPARCSGARPGGLALTPCASYDIRSPKVSRAACIPQYCPKPRLPSAAKTFIALKSMHLFQFLLN